MRFSLSCERSVAVQATPHVLATAAMFGLGLDHARKVTILPSVTFDLAPNEVVFITGPSGSGKSTLLRLIERNATINTTTSAGDAHVLNPAKLPAPIDAALVDGFADLNPAPELDTVLRWLSLAGLADAFVMLRRPSELSDGQRHRFMLARLFARAERLEDAPLILLLIDELGAALDRTTAMNLAAQLARWVRRSAAPICLVAATTHDDLLEPLAPDLLIHKDHGGAVEVLRR